MFGTFICKRSLPHVKNTVKASIFHEPYNVQNYPSLLFLKCISSIPNQEDHSSFTVNYLINSCGFSPESALSASKYVHIKTPQKPDSVLAFFKQHNFTNTQISTLIKRNPLLISANPEQTLLPKFNFFYSIGLTSTDLAKILCSAPTILRRSLKNQIVPSFTFCKNLFQDNEKIITALRKCPKIFISDIEGLATPNIAILKEFGVPDSNILTFLSKKPRTFLLRSDFFREIVKKVERMGINPIRKTFLWVVYALRSMKKVTWNRKLEVYKKWNVSEEEILVAFGKSIWFMMASEKKIMAVMDYFVNTMGWEAVVILNRPYLISLSLEKRIVPRCSVLQVLLSKGLIKKDFILSSLLESPEKLFLQKFVTCFEEEASQLLNLYKEKLDLGMRCRLVELTDHRSSVC